MRLHPKAQAARLRSFADHFFAQADTSDTEASFAAPQKTLFRRAKTEAQADAQHLRLKGHICLIQALELDP